MEFEKKVADFAEVNELWGSANKILLAVSGGADSTALMYAMCALRAQNILGVELLCAHINHQLRPGQADQDEVFVTAQAGELSLTIMTRRVDVREFAHLNKLSIETAARKLRIAALLDIAEANQCSRIATAHQKNDNAETIVQRLARGTGFRGLGGIWPMRAFGGEFTFVRPLLCVGADEIIEYLQKRNLKWRQDHTNADCTYRRNYIRHRLLPALQRDCAGPLVEQLSGLALSASRFHGLVCRHAEKAWAQSARCDGEKASLDLKGFLSQTQPVKVELVRRGLTTVGSGERDLTQRHYERVLRLAEQSAGGSPQDTVARRPQADLRRKIELPGGFAVRREYGKLIFEGPGETEPDEQISEPVKLEVPGRTSFGKCLIQADILETTAGGFEEFKADKTNFVECFDLDKVKPPVIIRSRRAGDRFVPLGLGAEKKVGKFVTAAKVPQKIRPKLLVVADREKIIWVWPVRITEQAKVTGETRRVLRLEITDAPV